MVTEKVLRKCRGIRQVRAFSSCGLGRLLACRTSRGELADISALEMKFKYSTTISERVSTGVATRTAALAHPSHFSHANSMLRTWRIPYTCMYVWRIWASLVKIGGAIEDK